MSEKITTLKSKRTSRTRQRSGAHPDQCQTAMGGRPRVCHLECGEHRTVMVNGEETAGHLTGDCADVAGPPRSAAPSLCGRFWASATSPNHYLCHNPSPS